MTIFNYNGKEYGRPGVYTKEIDFSIWSKPKRLIRLEKIEQLFGVKRTCIIWTATQKPNHPINNPLLINDYDDFENTFGSTNDLKKNI